MRFRHKTALLAVLPVLAIIALIAVIKLRNAPEPLTQEEVLKKQDWTADELAYTLARNFKPQAGDRDRKAIMEHLNRQLKKLPDAEQQQIKITAIRQAIDDTIRQYRALSPEARAQLVSKMQERAEKNLNNVNKMSAEQKAEINQRLSSPEGQAYSQELNNAMYNKLTPEERRDFNPIANLWLKTIKSL